MSERPLRAVWLGRVPYGEALALQEDAVRARRDERAPDTLLLLEHDPVITLGRVAASDHVLVSDEERRARGIELHETGRGGDVTYHGPGQLVGYPILALAEGRRDLHAYVRLLEAALVDLAATYGIEARREPGLTGVWVGDRKLAAIGVRVSAGWITSHGFAINVGDDVSGFDTIVPCGLRDREVTSIAIETGRAPALPEVAARAADALGRRFDLEVRFATIDAIAVATRSAR